MSRFLMPEGNYVLSSVACGKSVAKKQDSWSTLRKRSLSFIRAQTMKCSKSNVFAKTKAVIGQGISRWLSRPSDCEPVCWLLKCIPHANHFLVVGSSDRKSRRIWRLEVNAQAVFPYEQWATPFTSHTLRTVHQNLWSRCVMSLQMEGMSSSET